MKARRHLVIPDVQLRPGVPMQHLSWVGNYIADKRPGVIVCLGDFADMASLSSYDKGKASAEGKRYVSDCRAAIDGMERLTFPFRPLRGYRPRMEMVLGNHENRIARAAEDSPELLGAISVGDLQYARFGWRVTEFLRPIGIDQIEYCHYFTSGVMGRPVSSASALLRARHSSAVMGHVQKIDIAVHPSTQQIALMAGICYLHDEAYLGPQGNRTKRGVWLLNEVRGGTFDPMFVSLGYLQRRYS